MDTTIRNIDELAYRGLKARAAIEGRTIGETLTAAIQAYLARPDPRRRRAPLLDVWKPIDFPPGSERLSEELDVLLYGGG